MLGLGHRPSLSLGSGKYILAAKMWAGDEVTHEVPTRPGRFHALKGDLRVKEVTVSDGERKRRYVVRHNPLEEGSARKATIPVREMSAGVSEELPRSSQRYSFA